MDVIVNFNQSGLIHIPGYIIAGAFCKACALFAPEVVSAQKLGVIVTIPFNNWTSMSSVFRRHDKSKYHQDSMIKMDALKNTIANASTSISSRLCKEREERIKDNTEIIKSLFDCINFWENRV